MLERPFHQPARANVRFYAGKQQPNSTRTPPRQKGYGRVPRILESVLYASVMIFGLPRRGHRVFGNVFSFLVNCLVSRRLLASVRSGVVKTFLCVPQNDRSAQRATH